MKEEPYWFSRPSQLSDGLVSFFSILGEVYYKRFIFVLPWGVFTRQA